MPSGHFNEALESSWNMNKNVASANADCYNTEKKWN